MRRSLRIISLALFVAGLVVLADAGVTVAWKEPVSAVYSSLEQDQAASNLDEIEIGFPAGAASAAAEKLSDPAVRARRLAGRFQRQNENGDPFGRIRIPGTGINWVMLEGTDTDTLTRGPGHYPTTAVPGQGRTIGIAGHRTTYGAPFRNINQIEDGDEITLQMPYGTFRYEVTRTRIVEPSDVQIVRDIGRERIVLTACHPLYSAAQRYAVFADLVELEPSG